MDADSPRQPKPGETLYGTSKAIHIEPPRKPMLDLRPIIALSFVLVVALAVCGVLIRDSALLQSQRGYSVNFEELLEPGVKYRLDGEFLETEGKCKRYVSRPYRAEKYPYGKRFIVVDGVPVVVDEATQCGCVPGRCKDDDCRWRLSPEQRRIWTNALEGISDGMPPKPGQ